MLTTVYVARHGFRMSSTLWRDGNMNLERDPPLTAHGQNQVRDLARFFGAMPPDERPQVVVSSPYTRCLQTAAPVARELRCKLFVEPGIAEWYPPVSDGDQGVHPSPPSARHVQASFPDVAADWTPLLYPDPAGDSIPGLHRRMIECFRRLEVRCTALGVSRVLLVAHAAPIIALGRMLLADGDFAAAQAINIRAGTASLSEYKRSGERWECLRNGDTSFLPHGAEREWDFSFVPDNVTEAGMRAGWVDPHEPEDPSLIFRGKAHL